MKYNLLTSALHHPDSEHPYRGLFNKRTLQSFVQHKDCSITVFAPVPYAPPIGPQSEYRSIPMYESFSTYDVIRPRFLYLLPKSFFYSVTGRLYRRTLRESTAGTTPDILHGCHVYPDGYGLISVSNSQELPLTVTCHGHFLNNFTDLPLGVANQVRETLTVADHVFCVSDALTEKATTITPHENISTVPIGANPKNFPTEQEEQLRDKYNIAPDTAVVLFCGQFINRKGVGDIIDSLHQFPCENTKYVFVGHDGDLTEKLRAAANSTRSPGNIRIHTGLDTETLREWYAISDLFLLPSYKEGRPTAIYEAMAAETAVLSTRIDGVSEQVDVGKTGQLIQPGNINELTEAIRKMTSEKEQLLEMGKKGRERLIAKGWTWHNHANKIINIHTEILDNSA